MKNTLKFKAVNKKLSQIKTSLFVTALFKNDKLNNSLDVLMDGNLKKSIKLESFKGDYKKQLLLYGNDLNRVVLFGLGSKEEFCTDYAREIGAIVADKANQLKIDEITIDASAYLLNKKEISQAFFEGVVLGNYQFVDYKSEKKSLNTLKKINIFGSYNDEHCLIGQTLGDSVNFGKDLGNHPANVLTPTYLANSAKVISATKNMKCKIIDVKDFQKLGLGSFYGVARGAKEPAKLIIVEYNGGNKKQKPLALVGKGVTFDTGGISIKPSPSMDEMKFDMCGSAVVMGVLKAVSILKPKLNLVFAIGATENMPGGDAQRPGDIVTAYNGKTIEVLNTDAEGRLVLADVLSYVNKNYTPDSIIDFATLTGAVLIALGDQASAIMGNSDKLINEIKKSSQKTDEKVWELPMWDVYSKDIKSKIADIKNLGRSRLAGTIAGGVFLKEFVDDTPWVHMDIAGTAWGPKEPLYQPKNGATGVAIRLVYNLISNRVK